MAVVFWVAIYRINRQHIAVADQSGVLFGSKKMTLVLVYSTFVSLVLTIGAILHISSFKEAVADLMFLPVTIQLLFWFLPKLKGTKK